MGKNAVSESVKCQVVGLVKSKNHSNVKTANLVGVSEFHVQKTVKTWELTGDVINMHCSERQLKLSVQVICRSY